MSKAIRSYTSVERGFSRHLRLFVNLVTGSMDTLREMETHVAGVLEIAREAEDLVARHTGMTIEGLKALEIGPGQLPRHLAYFALKNDVVGIDLDVVPMGFDIGGYWSMLRRNGPVRLTKTLARKMLGVDARFRAEMARQLEVSELPRYTLRQTDATRMDFADGSLDFVYSFDVFEHLPEPGPVLAEAARVLRPGGCAFQSVHPFTADDGFHDLRLGAGHHEGIPYWAHLRPEHQHTVQASAYLNRLSLQEWRETFRDKMPGVLDEVLPTRDPQARSSLDELRAAGELDAYTDEELLARRIVFIWQKPGG